MASILKIISDLDCNIYIDDEFVCKIYANEYHHIPLQKGTYDLRIVLSSNENIFIQKEYIMPDHDMQDLLRISLANLLKEEKELAWKIKNRVLRETETHYEIFDNSTNQSIPLPYSFADPFSEGLAVVQRGGTYGKVEVAPGEYLYLPELGGWGYIDIDGNEIIKCQYFNAREFKDGLACINTEEDEKFGFIDRSGKLIIPQIYDTADSFSNGLSLVSLCEKYGYINKHGKVVIGFQFSEACPFVCEYACVKNEDKWGVINKKGEYIVTPNYHEIDIVFNDLLRVRVNDKWGIVNFSGDEIVPVRYDSCRFTEISDVYEVEIYGEKSLRNSSGEFLIDENTTIRVLDKYSLVKYKSMIDSTVPVCYNGKWGIVNLQGEVISPCKFLSIKSEYGGYTAELDREEWPEETVKIKALDGDLFMVLRQSIDAFTYADFYVPVRYDWGRFITEQHTAVTLNGKWGVINDKGEEIISIKYDDIDNRHYDTPIYYNSKNESYILIKAELGDKWIVINSLKGEE